MIGRNIPFTVLVRLVVGNGLTQVSLIFFSIALLFFYIFTILTDFKCPYLFESGTGKTDGEIKGCRETNISVDRRNVIEVLFSYRVDNKEMEGLSYTEGLCGEKIGKVAKIEYVLDNPTIARIEGMRCKPMPQLGLLSIFAPILVSIFVLWGIIRGVERSRCLKYGEIVEADIQRIRRISSRRKGMKKYEIELEFDRKDGKHEEVEIETHVGKGWIQGQRIYIIYYKDMVLPLAEFSRFLESYQTDQIRFRFGPLLILPVVPGLAVLMSAIWLISMDLKSRILISLFMP